MAMMQRPMAHLAAAWRSLWSGPLTSNSPEIARLFSSTPTSTGVGVSETTALNYSAFWACVNAISTDVASLPLNLYKRLPKGGKERYDGHRLYSILHDEPNTENGSMTMRETLTAHVLTWGNGYAEIERDVQNRAIALWPITPDRVDPFRDPTGAIQYKVNQPNNGGFEVIPAADMLHIHGLGFDGLMGYSIVAKARESIGLGISTERFGGTFFGQGSTFGGVMEHPGRMSEQAQKNWREWMNSQHQGVEKAHKFLIAEEGMKYQRLGIPPNDAQFLETRLHQVEEMCRWFRMPPHKIQHLLRATNNNIEHQGIEYSTDTLHPWCVRWEQEINRKLIAPSERRIQFAEHLIEGKLRGDMGSRYAAYAVGRQWGWLSADDVREKENLNPLPNGTGQIYLVPMNMTPASLIDDLVNAQIKSKTAPPTPPAGDPNAQKNAMEMVDAIRVALTETEQRAEAHLARAVAAEAAAIHATDGGAVLRVEAEIERAAALGLASEVGTLKALLLEATEREARDRAERDAIAEELATTRADLTVQVEAQTALAVTAETAYADVAADLAAERGSTAAALAETAEERAANAANAQALAAACIAREEAAIFATTAQDAQRAAEAALADLQVGYDSEANARVKAALREAELSAALTAQRDSEQKRLVAVIGAHRSLIVDAMGRMIRQEVSKARQHRATPEKLRRWIASYDVIHEPVCADAVMPALRAHLVWMGSEEDAAILAADVARSHIVEFRRRLGAALEADPQDFDAVLDRVLGIWESTRADEVADVFMQKKIDYARTR